MNIAEGLGCLVLFSCVGILFLCTVKGTVSFNIRQYDMLLMVTMAAILILVYNFDPRPSIRFDLHLHRQLLEDLQRGGWNFGITYSEYSNLYVTLAYFYLISKIGDYRLLSIFPMIVDFMVFRHIYFDQIKRRCIGKIKAADAVFVLYVWFCTYGFLLSITGIRCVCAMNIMVLAIYRDYVKEKRGPLTWLLYVLPVFIHSFAVIAVIIRGMTLIKWKKALTFVMLLSLFGATKIIPLIYNLLPTGYMKYTFSLLSKYWLSQTVGEWMSRADKASQLVFFCFVLVVVYLIYVIYVVGQHKDSLDREDYRIYELAKVAACIGLVVVFNYLFLERFMYVIAYAYVMILPLYQICRRHSIQNSLINISAVLVMTVLMFFHELYMILVNYTGSYFLAF